TVCVVGKMRDLILQLSKSSIYSTKPLFNVMIIWIFIEGMFIFGPSFVIHRATIRQAIKRKKVRKLFSLFIIHE
ncbi:hypothetical protein, partial [Klebsiella pneumoniae]|uniref:hypothetical protein n=1 Tax=Klebsiella pneumoniae TaxID=573 RepID=UPI0039C01C75